MDRLDNCKKKALKAQQMQNEGMDRDGKGEGGGGGQDDSDVRAKGSPAATRGCVRVQIDIALSNACLKEQVCRSTIGKSGQADGIGGVHLGLAPIPPPPPPPPPTITLAWPPCRSSMTTDEVCPSPSQGEQYPVARPCRPLTRRHLACVTVEERTNSSIRWGQASAVLIEPCRETEERV